MAFDEVFSRYNFFILGLQLRHRFMISNDMCLGISSYIEEMSMVFLLFYRLRLEVVIKWLFLARRSEIMMRVLEAWRYSFLWQSKCIKIVLTKRWLLPSVTACYGNGNMRLNDDCSCPKNPIQWFSFLDITRKWGLKNIRSV